MTSKEPQNTEEEEKGVKRVPIMGLLALIIVMMSLTAFKLSGIMFPEPEKRELPENLKYCLHEIKAGSVIKLLEEGGEIYPTADFSEKLSDCYERMGFH